MSKSRGRIVVLGGLAAALLLIWLVPVLGLLAAVAYLAIVPPWGRTLVARGLISSMFVLGILGAGVVVHTGLPLSWLSVHLYASAALIAAALLRLVFGRDCPVIPRVRTADMLALAGGVAAALLVLIPFIGRDPGQIVSGLFTSWDLQAHYTFFANTFEAGSPWWVAANGSDAYGYEYPRLPATVWTALQQLSMGSGTTLTRFDLLLPYTVWFSATIGFCVTALAWVASDAARRMSPQVSKSAAAATASVLVGLASCFGVITVFASAGHTNFLLSVTLVVAGTYAALRSRTSAVRYGWALVPAVAVAAVATWPPMALGAAVAVVGVSAALWRTRWWLGLGYLVLAIAAVPLVGRDFVPRLISGDLEALSARGEIAGLTPINISMAIAAPIVIVVLSIMVGRARGWLLAIAMMSASVGIGIFAIRLMFSVDSYDTARLQSYFLIKTLGGLFVAAWPFVIAFLAVALAAGWVTLRDTLPAPQRAWRAVTAAGGVVIVAASFGYVGVNPESLPSSFPKSPGPAFFAAKNTLMDTNMLGPMIVKGAEIAEKTPHDLDLFWDAGLSLPSAWIHSLIGVRSYDAEQFSQAIGNDPNGIPPAEALVTFLKDHPDLSVEVLWKENDGFNALLPVATEFDPDRITLTFVG